MAPLILWVAATIALLREKLSAINGKLGTASITSGISMRS
jgi:hypothetical protein